MRAERIIISNISQFNGSTIRIAGWVYRVRKLSEVTFIILRDRSGEIQCVGSSTLFIENSIRTDEAIEIIGIPRADARAKGGVELEIVSFKVLNEVSDTLPFNSHSDIENVSAQVITDHRPLSLRNDREGKIFKVQAAILRLFREFLTQERFLEIVTPKIVASGTEGGTNLFEIRYFDRTAYLAQSPQFYKEHGVAGFERVFETAPVFRGEPHLSSRHLTQYYSLDLEMGFIDGPEEIMELERKLLTWMFSELEKEFPNEVGTLPSMTHVPSWDFHECIEKLKRPDLIDDLDPEAERELCKIAEQETGVPAVFVIGFPLIGRPFYTAPRGNNGGGQSFDLLFRGLEITTGGQRLHKRSDIEKALIAQKMEPKNFESHLRMFELGMPPHGGLAIGLERLTMQLMGLKNVRQATIYPRDRNKIEP